MILQKKLTVIIPCYNEGYIIQESIENVFLQLKDYDIKVIIVNDGSVDGTHTNVKKLLGKYKGRLRLVSYNHNVGKGHAIYEGFWYAFNWIREKGTNYDVCKYDNILILDADLSVHPINIKHFKKNYRGRMPKYFIIKGQRIQTIPQPLYRIFVGKCWKALVWLRTGIWMDTQCPYTYLKCPPGFFMNLVVEGFAFDVELLKKAKSMNIPIFTQNVQYRNNLSSSVTIGKTWEMFKELLRLG